MNNTTDLQVEATLNRKLTTWYDFLNNLYGLVGFALAVSCLGTNSPKFYACLSLIFLISVYLPKRKKYQQFLKFLREIRHRRFGLAAILVENLPFVIGFSSLVLVAVGYFK